MPRLCDFPGPTIFIVIHFYYTPYGWELDSWHNITITILAIGVAIRLAVVSGRSFGEAFLPASMDETVVETLRRRFLADGQENGELKNRFLLRNSTA
jgi:hypothetical protein